MKIIGPDRIVFAAKGDAAVGKYLGDYGLQPADAPAGVERWIALDGTGIDLVAADDPAWPNTLGTSNRLRQIVYGVADKASLDAIAAEFSVSQRGPEGEVDLVDPIGAALRFQLTCRQPLDLPAETLNAPGAPVQRGVNMVALPEEFAPRPRALSHFAIFAPDVAAIEQFYCGRLGFRVTDRLGNGYFIRPAGTFEHHTMFVIPKPPPMPDVMIGIEHLTFHFGGPTEVLRGGKRMLELGYPQFWGPGRHQMGGNWFWYFNSPLGCNFEFDADMDLHDDTWVPREAPQHVDNAQLFLFQPRDNWAPFAAPPPGAKPAEGG
jgi:catechol 2,3-dioxygenase-like lactoylglutathione lyase family enzyme